MRGSPTWPIPLERSEISQISPTLNSYGGFPARFLRCARRSASLHLAANASHLRNRHACPGLRTRLAPASTRPTLARKLPRAYSGRDSLPGNKGDGDVLSAAGMVTAAPKSAALMPVRRARCSAHARLMDAVEPSSRSSVAVAADPNPARRRCTTSPGIPPPSSG